MPNQGIVNILLETLTDIDDSNRFYVVQLFIYLFFY